MNDTDSFAIVDRIVQLDRPWPQAFAVRSILRALPVFFSQVDPSMIGEILKNVRPEVLLEIPRYIYLSAFRFERGYRARVLHQPVEPGIEEAFSAGREMLGRKLDELGHWREQFGLLWEVALLLAQDGRDEPYLAGRTIRSIGAALPQAESQALFQSMLERDWKWCQPLDSQEPEHMLQFFTEPLWGQTMPSGEQAFQQWMGWIQELGSLSATDPRQAILALYRQHFSGQTLDWVHMRQLILQGDTAPLTSAQRLDFLALVENPERIARLIARLAFTDRTYCDLASSPSSTGFKEALRSQQKHHPVGLLELEASQTNGHGAFQPNPLWLAWMTNACRPALTAIREELRSWLPPEHVPPAPPAPAEPPKPTAPAVTPAPPLPTEEAPSLEAVPAPATETPQAAPAVEAPVERPLESRRPFRPRPGQPDITN